MRSVLSPVPSNVPSHSHHTLNRQLKASVNDQQNQSPFQLANTKKRLDNHPPSSPNFYIQIPVRNTTMRSNSAGTKRKRGLLNTTITTTTTTTSTGPRTSNTHKSIPQSPPSSREVDNLSEWSSAGSLSDPNSVSSSKRRLSSNSNSPNGRALRRELTQLHLSNGSPKSDQRSRKISNTSKSRDRRVASGAPQSEDEEEEEEGMGGAEHAAEEDEGEYSLLIGRVGIAVRIQIRLIAQLESRKGWRLIHLSLYLHHSSQTRDFSRALPLGSSRERTSLI